MYKINNQNYYADIYKSTTKHRLKISIDNDEINTKYLKKFKLDDYCFSDDFFSLGGATLCSVEMEIDKDAFTNITINEGSKFYFEEVVTINNEEVTIPIGYFFVHLDLLDSQDDYVYKFVLYDKLYDLIQATIDFSEKIDDEDFTRLELVKFICTTYGIELGSTEFINSDKIVATYDNQLSCVSWLSFCAERAGGFVKIGRDGKLYIKSFGSVDKIVIPPTTRGETIKGDIKTITGVTYQNATQCFNAGNSTGVVVYLSQDNYFSCTQEEVDAIYNNLKNINFQSLKVRIWGDSSIDTGDIIQIGDLVTFCQKSWEFGNGFYGYYDTQIKEAKNSLDVKKLNNNQKLRRAYSLIDEVNGKVDIAVENIDETSKKMAEMEQTVDGITTTVSTITTEVDNTIKSVSKQFKIKDSTDDWSDTLPTREEGQVILAREKYIHTDDSITYGTEYEITGDKGDDGIDGTTYYTWIKYADTPTSGMSDNPTGKTYIGFAHNKTTATESTNYSDYSWSLIKGEDGKDGVDGVDGKDGVDGTNGKDGKDGTDGADGNGISNISYYYATTTTQTAPAASSITSTTIPTLSKTNKYLWQKEVITFTVTATPQTTISLIAVYGDDGIQGPAGADGTSQYFYVRYSQNSTGNPMTITPDENTQYMGVASTTSSTAPTSYTDYTWSKTKGNTGATGSAGATGADGQTTYLHIMYSVDGEDFAPATEEYAKGKNPSAWRGEYVDFTEADSTEFSDYTWYKLTESIDGRLDSIEQDIADTNKNYKTYTDNEIGKVNEKFDGYATTTVVSQIESKVSTALSDSQYAIDVTNEIKENGVTKLKTEKGFTFDNDGMTINSTDSKTSFNADTNGIDVIDKSSNTTLLFAGYDSTLKRSVVRTDNIEIDNYVTIGDTYRLEVVEDATYGKGLAFFNIGG